MPIDADEIAVGGRYTNHETNEVRTVVKVDEEQVQYWMESVPSYVPLVETLSDFAAWADERMR